MRALVTGGAGFVGAHVARALLEDGMEVALLDDLSTGRFADLRVLMDLGVREGDIFVVEAGTEAAEAAVVRSRPEVLVHLAAQARVPESVRDPAGDACRNVLGTLRMLQAAVRAGVRLVVVASSGGAVYGEQVGAAAPTQETRPTRPCSPYGVSKAAADAYARIFADQFDLPVTVLRLGNVYGRRIDGELGPGVLGEFARALLAGTGPNVHGDGTQTRDFVHVMDVAEAFRLSCRAPSAGAVNIGSGTETSVLEAYQMVCDVVGVHPLPRQLPTAAAEVRRVCLDTSRAERLLGWRAVTPLPAGVKRLVHGD